ncbi:hypothetical protein DRN51_07745 [Thermococci archaeon]|nr:MAG: hypothetical protein DRN51_07745 [Thermococci archaeon]
MWRKALALGLVLMALGVVVGGAVGNSNIILGAAYGLGWIGTKALTAGATILAGVSTGATGAKEVGIISGKTLGYVLIAVGIAT